MKQEHTPPLIEDGQTLKAAKSRFGYSIPVYDDGFGPLWISRNSMSINGIVRAQTWEDAYGICEDEFFPEADETMEELIKEYGFRRQHLKIVKDSSVLTATDICSAGEREARFPEDYPEGKLAPECLRWALRETPDAEAWADNALFQESYGFRPNGANERDKIKHGIYAKDLNGDVLDPLTAELLEDLGITLEIETEE